MRAEKLQVDLLFGSVQGSGKGPLGPNYALLHSFRGPETWGPCFERSLC